MKVYDFIIAGGGVAGLSLAYHLAQSSLGDRSILIIDKQPKTHNDRTLSFWTDQPTLFDDIVYRSWSQLQFIGDTMTKTFNLENYRYQMIRGLDFYQFVRQSLSDYPNVEFLSGTVQRLNDGDDYATVWVDGQPYAGRWLFDSCFKPAARQPQATYNHLNLHFRGWEIETPTPVFEPDLPTLMDFRAPQKQDIRFFYVLPFSPQRALIEHTIFSTGHLSPEENDAALRHYIETTMGIKAYTILEREGGLIPATDQPFPRRLGRRILSIGTLGGQVKPSTGYAFGRIQQDSAHIVKSLRQKGHPFDLPSTPAFYGFCDSLMLQVMADHGAHLKSIFTAMFKNNSIGRIFRFLDEKAGFYETCLLIATLPPRLFLQTLAQSRVLSRLKAVQPDSALKPTRLGLTSTARHNP